ncbi:10773_t:CDS:2 [Gigaspora rosea]|nr:10773_t:CDS:2 [Gigaspora rosea]
MEAIEYFTRVSNSPELINESQKGETVPSLEYSKQFNKWLRQAAGNGHTEAEELNISLIYQVELSEFAKLSALCKELKIVSTPSLTSNTSVFTNSIQLKIQSNIIEQNHIELIAKWINEVSNLNQNTFIRSIC